VNAADIVLNRREPHDSGALVDGDAPVTKPTIRLA
jgi:hypothetical protein